MPRIQMAMCQALETTRAVAEQEKPLNSGEET